MRATMPSRVAGKSGRRGDAVPHLAFSIQLTVDTYGKWLPMGNKAAVDGLDTPSGSKVVATAGQDADADPQAADFPEATRRSRTGDLLITNQLLYRLS